ncbi:MAG: hypothetical protein HQ517_15900 [SAR324 cluster bacterium]|nr:hypothetical protein [SAR324 cluster bacterium]
MIRRVQIAIGGSVFFVLLLAIGSINQVLAENQTTNRQINCDIQKRSCTQKLAERDITLDIRPKPVKAMENLIFTITVTGQPLVTQPRLDLGMPGMSMGRNRVSLKESRPGVYEGTGVIVKCPSGRTVWRATVTFPEEGTVDYIFDVIY